MKAQNNPWKKFFDHHAAVYMQEVFTRHTEEEVQFLVDELSLPAGSHILDVGCGTGRHAIGLAKLGYRVTGIDLSMGMLEEAKRAAQEAGVQVDWIQQDATQLQLTEAADAVICLCEGSFGLIGSADEAYAHERMILEAIHRSAKPGARLILTALNGLAKIRALDDEKVKEGAFDPLTIAERFDMEISSGTGQQTVEVIERGFVPSELRLLLEVCGFDVLGIYGGTAGSWKREMVSLDEMEIMAIAVRI